jgi:hypothetical protein
VPPASRRAKKGLDEKVLVYEKKTFGQRESEHQGKDASGEFQSSSIEFVPET